MASRDLDEGETVDSSRDRVRELQMDGDEHSRENIDWRVGQYRPGVVLTLQPKQALEVGQKRIQSQREVAGPSLGANQM